MSATVRIGAAQLAVHRIDPTQPPVIRSPSYTGEVYELIADIFDTETTAERALARFRRTPSHA